MAGNARSIRTSEDSAFKERYSNPSKNIEECCNYIIGQVQKSKRQGFTDEEVYKMARDYYVDDIEKVEKISATVVVNHAVELTEEEKEKAHKEALEEFKAQEQAKFEEESRKQKEAEEKAKQKEMEKIKKAEEKKAKKLEQEKEKMAKQVSLFDLI